MADSGRCGRPLQSTTDACQLLFAPCGPHDSRMIHGSPRGRAARAGAGAILVLTAALSAMAAGQALGQKPAAAADAAGLEFIDTSLENASPLWYDVVDDVVRLHLIYDHERASPNRAAGHIHFRIHARTGAQLTLEFLNLDNVWNGQPGSVAAELKTLAISEDGQTWKTVPTESLPGNRVQLHVDMKTTQLYVARMQPYRLSDLEKLLEWIRPRRRVQSPAL